MTLTEVIELHIVRKRASSRQAMKLSTVIAIIALAICSLSLADVWRQYMALVEGVVTAVPMVEQAYRERTQRLDAAIEASGG